MEIRLKKGRTKNTLVCNRKNGTSTWTQIDRFFVMHDLAHFCVENVLEMKNGFYGLVARGKDISDFENKEKIRAKALPEESILGELIVGLVLTERSDNSPVIDFNKTLKEMAAMKGVKVSKEVGEEELRSIRRDLDDLLNQWTFLQPEEELTLYFKE